LDLGGREEVTEGSRKPQKGEIYISIVNGEVWKWAALPKKNTALFSVDSSPETSHPISQLPHGANTHKLDVTE
jgi:hypothetical protein